MGFKILESPKISKQKGMIKILAFVTVVLAIFAMLLAIHAVAAVVFLFNIGRKIKKHEERD